MTENAPRVAKQFLTYGVGTISQTALSFVLMPVYMGKFTAEEYGVIALLLIVVQFSSMVASAGMMSALHRMYFTVADTDRRRLAGTSAVWHLCLGGIVGTALVVFSEPLANALFGTTERTTEVQLLGFYFLFNFALEVPFNLLRLEERGAAYVFFSLLRFGVDFTLKILLVIIASRGVIGYLESSLAAALVTLIVITVAVRRLIVPAIYVTHLRKMLRIGIPFIFSGFAIWSLGATDRMLLNFFSGQSEVGLYAVGQKFSAIFNILLYTPCSLLLPAVLFRYAEEHDQLATSQLLAKLMSVLVVGGAFVYLSISLVTRDLLYVFSEHLGAREEYVQSASLIPIMVVAPFAYFLSICGGYSLLLAKRPEFTSLAAVIGAALNIILNLFMIPSFGAIGAATSTSISYGLYVFFVYFWARKHSYYVPYDWRGVFFVLGVTLIISTALWLIPVRNHVVGLVVRAPVGIIILSIALYLSPRPFTKDLRTMFAKRTRFLSGTFSFLSRKK